VRTGEVGSFKRATRAVDGKDAMHLAGYIVAYGIVLGCAVICAMKGKFGFVALGVFLPIFWIVGAVRPSKPGSSWASRFHDDHQLSERSASDPN
jgi:hypothetical protein